MSEIHSGVVTISHIKWTNNPGSTPGLSKKTVEFYSFGV